MCGSVINGDFVNFRRRFYLHCLCLFVSATLLRCARVKTKLQLTLVKAGFITYNGVEMKPFRRRIFHFGDGVMMNGDVERMFVCSEQFVPVSFRSVCLELRAKLGLHCCKH